MKPQKIKLSRLYVNERGELIKNYSPLEKMGLKIYAIFASLPVIVNFMVVSLLLGQVCCLVGLMQALSNAKPSDLGIYLFLMLFMGIICSLAIGMGWYLVEEKLRRERITTHQFLFSKTIK